MSVISKVDDKVLNIISTFTSSFSEDEFLERFKTTYTKDYEKCMKRFLDEERKTKPGKHHPMQHPDHHIKCALRSFISRSKKQISNKS